MQKEISHTKNNQKDFDEAKIKKWLLNIIKDKKLYRKELITECVKRFCYTKEILKDNASDSLLTKTKSIIGSIVSEMLNSKDIIYNENHKIQLNEEVSIIEIKDNFRNLVIELLKKDKFRKEEIFKKCEEKYPNSKKNIRSLAGQLLNELVKNKIIEKEKNYYILSLDSKYPNTEIGNCFKNVEKGQDLKKNFINILNLKGGEFFEQYSVNLIAKVIEKNRTILQSKVTGGPNDKGIDGIIENIDQLGFKNTILIQAKTRAKGVITVKEIREFFGALIAEAGTQGIFITTSTIHSEGNKFLKRVPNLIGIDKNQIFDLAKKYNYGIINNKQLDADLFLD